MYCDNLFLSVFLGEVIRNNLNILIIKLRRHHFYVTVGITGDLLVKATKELAESRSELTELVLEQAHLNRMRKTGKPICAYIFFKQYK